MIIDILRMLWSYSGSPPPPRPQRSPHNCGQQEMAALLLSFLALSGPSPMPTKSLEMLLITGADCVIQTQRVRKIASLLFIYFHESFSNSLNRL